MVARNRFNPMQMGAEIAPKVISGFSRLPEGTWLKNDKAGLYAYKVNKHDVSLREMGRHFDKERQRKRVKASNFKRNESQKMRKTTRRMSFYGGCNRDSLNVQSHDWYQPHNEKSVKVYKNSGSRNVQGHYNRRNCLRNNRQIPNKSYEVRAHRFKVSNKQKTKIDIEDIAIRELMEKFKHRGGRYAKNALSIPNYDTDQQKKKLKMLNSLIHSCHEVSSRANEARNVLVSNLRLRERIDMDHCSDNWFLRRKFADHLSKSASQRLPKNCPSPVKCRRRTNMNTRKACREYAFSMEVIDAEMEMTGALANLPTVHEVTAEEGGNRIGSAVTSESVENGDDRRCA